MFDELKEIQAELDRVLDRLEAITNKSHPENKEYLGAWIYAYAMRRGQKNRHGYDYDLFTAMTAPRMAEFGWNTEYPTYLYGDHPGFRERERYHVRKFQARVEGKDFKDSEPIDYPLETTEGQEEKADFMWAIHTIICATDACVPPPRRSLLLAYWPMLRYLRRYDKYIGEFWTKKKFEHPSKSLDRTGAKRWTAAMMVGELRLSDPENNPASKGSPRSVYARVGSRLGMSESNVERAYIEFRDDVERVLTSRW